MGMRKVPARSQCCTLARSQCCKPERVTFVQTVAGRNSVRGGLTSSLMRRKMVVIGILSLEKVEVMGILSLLEKVVVMGILSLL